MRVPSRTGWVLFSIWAIGCGGGGTSTDVGVSGDVTSDAIVALEDTDEGNEDGEIEVVCPDACDDGLDCTDDTCEATGCVHLIVARFCLADGVCWGQGELHSTDPCLVCDAEQASDSWSGVPDGLKCDDGTPCTLDDYCELGVCTGKAKPCDDGNECTDDLCEPATGGVCFHEANTAVCDDDDLCTTDDLCEEAVCVGGASPCDDDDLCTNDFCQDEGDCAYMPVICDDENPCTFDACDPFSGCIVTPTDGASCEAGDKCKTGDICVQDLCVEGTEPEICEDDENVCTTSTCLPNAGCVHLLNQDECDDGFECTLNDACVATLCKGTDTGTCEACDPDFSSSDVQKATLLVFGEGGVPGEGMDVDGDENTCAPALSCSDGIDNALGVLATVLNPLLEKATEDGAIAPLLLIEQSEVEGGSINVSILNGVPESAISCDVQEETCEYLVLTQSYGPDCLPTVQIQDAVIEGTHLSAGGPGTVLVMDLPVSGDKPHHLFIVGGRMEATLTLDPTGTEIIAVDGIVAGAVPKQELLKTVATIDPAYFPGSTTEEMVGLVDILVEEDIDLDGDGEMDAASVGIRFKTIPGIITGVQEQ